MSAASPGQATQAEAATLTTRRQAARFVEQVRTTTATSAATSA